MLRARHLIFGAGWIGRGFEQRIADSVLTPADITDAAAIAEALNRHQPAFVLNCAGKTGHPNIDACEAHPGPTYASNVAGPILLARACHERGIHLTHLSSGCIYEGDHGGRGFSEEDPPNFAGSLYSRSKAAGEAALREFGALQLRLRMPLASEPHPRNLLTKLLGFSEVVRAANSITILDDFWAPALELIGRREQGVFNMVNEGVEYHDEILALWCQQGGEPRRVQVITPEALRLRTIADRSNCLLSTAKARAAGVGLPHLSESLPRVLRAYASAKERVR